MARTLLISSHRAKAPCGFPRHKGAISAEQQNSLDLQVFRQVIDDNPLQMITRLELNVSGAAQGSDIALMPCCRHSFPIRLDSPLPARIEPDGRLLVQVRAGRWMIDIHARHPQTLSRLVWLFKIPTGRRANYGLFRPCRRYGWSKSKR